MRPTFTSIARAAAIGAMLAAVAACGSDAPAPSPEAPAVATPGTSPEPAPTSSTAPACSAPSCGTPDGPKPSTPPSLRVRFLGVQGFVVEHGDDVLLTSPLFTRPNGVVVTTGLPVTSDASLVVKNLPSPTLSRVRAVLSGHAHYDHLLDTPAVMARAPNATLYSNRSAKNLLAAFAPDRGASCAGKPAQADVVPRARVVAMDDPAKSVVDYRNCPAKRPAGAPLEGTWVTVPGASMRVLAVCSEHQDQIGPIHYGEGDVDDEQCTAPKNMNDWKEGVTLGFLVDFLDAKTGKPVHRVYYEDSPASSPVGQIPSEVLAEKQVDLALLCVGTYDKVPNAPANLLGTMRPRFALGGHWEDFLRSADEPLQPIPFLDVAAWDTKAKVALDPSQEPTKMLRNGAVLPDRVTRPQPGDVFDIR